MLLSLIKKSFKQVLENNSLILFLVAYLILTSLITPFVKTKLMMIIIGICVILLTIVFFSGWFQIFNVIAKTKDEKEINKNVFLIFLEGIGKNFLSGLIAFVMYTVVMSLTLYLVGMIANHYFGDINIVLKDIMATMNENKNLLAVIAQLPEDKQVTLYGWQFCLIIAGCILGFVFLLYCPALIDSKKNAFLRPFLAFYDSIKVTIKNILPTIGLYVILYASYFILSILRALSEFNSILSVVMFFIYIYFLVLTVMIIFNYYEEKNNSSDRADCIWENKALDTTGKEN